MVRLSIVSSFAVFGMFTAGVTIVPKVGAATTTSKPALSTSTSSVTTKTMTASSSTIQVRALNDHLIYFFDGRRPGERYAKEWNWFDDSAMKLGIGTYVIYQGGEAVVYDTFTSVPQAKFVRDHMEKMGITKFSVVHSHWHLDHVAGDSVYDDSDVVSSVGTRDAMQKQKTEIEAGKTWGPPGIKPLRIPNVTYVGAKLLKIGSLNIELRQINIHSIDQTVILLPKDKILLAGDTVEDSLTYMVEVENLATHIKNLRKMRTWKFDKIYPNHGDPAVIMSTGYSKSIIDATTNYITLMLERSHDDNFLMSKMEDYIGPSVAKGWVHKFEPYRDVHTQNLKLVSDYWKSREIPKTNQ
jgi:cyclase